jgi:hypothetical protein
MGPRVPGTPERIERYRGASRAKSSRLCVQNI